MRKADLIKPKYTGILQTFALVAREEGPLALWKGNGANGALFSPRARRAKSPTTSRVRNRRRRRRYRRRRRRRLCASAPPSLFFLAVLRVIPVYGLKFSFNDSFKAVVAGPARKTLTVGQLLTVGTLSGLFQTIITYPLETLRTRLSLGAEQGGVRYAGIFDCVRQMVRSEGAGAL